MSELKSIDIGNYFAFIGDTGDLTNLKLQKLVYYASGFYNSLYNERLFKEDIEAWDYGPVIPPLYHAYKGFKDHTVRIKSFTIDKIPLRIQQFLNKIYERFARYSANELVDMTHYTDTPWHVVYHDDSYDYVINDHLMMVYFSEYQKQRKTNLESSEMQLVELLSKDSRLAETMYLVKDYGSARNFASTLTASQNNDVMQFDYRNEN